MATYLIHACLDRMWYVQKYLIPSMKAQGIKESDIIVYTDTERLGNLKACMESLMLIVPNDNSGIWHLQDDVVISKYFKERTEQYDDGLVCGFCSKYSLENPVGVVTGKDMWYSFPCIRIPNVLVKSFVSWFYQKAVNTPGYENWIKANKYDDEFFKIFIKTRYPNIKIRNLSPNLVDHVDYLLGGSTIKSRKDQVRSIYWNEDDVIKRLESDLERDDIRNELCTR